VWATGPFLHNGSVPNLYEMLIPAQAAQQEILRRREFDPVKVGIDTSGKSGCSCFDTSLIGNSNAGHSFENGPRGNGVIGPLLTDAQRVGIGRVPEVHSREGGPVPLSAAAECENPEIRRGPTCRPAETGATS
jgi:hypothetical protein